MSSSKIINLYKRAGETPLESIERFRATNPAFRDIKMSYAGRLDPMAEGALLVLVGSENKKREEYLELEKEYVFDALFGVKTDTYDVLGKVQAYEKNTSSIRDWVELEQIILDEIKNLKGKMVQPYPPYSSKPVKGIPLFEWARKGKIDEIDIPQKEIEIHAIKHLFTYIIPKEDLQKVVFELIHKVKGDFRQTAIIKEWMHFFELPEPRFFYCMRFIMRCSSGTYVRSVVNNLGKKVGAGALALRIVRTRIGEHTIHEAQE